MSNAHEKEVTLTVRKAAYITHFFRKMKGQTLNNSPFKIREMGLSSGVFIINCLNSVYYKNTLKL